MNKVKLVIDNCASCPFFDNHYYSYSEECKLLGVKIKRAADFGSYPIPSSCPLQMTDEPVTEG